MPNTNTKRSTASKSHKPPARTGSKAATKQRLKRGAAEPDQYIENGHEVLDLAAGDRNNKRAASLVFTILEAEIVPLWLREAITENLAEAARRIGSPLRAPVFKDGKVTVVPNDNPYFQNPRENLKTLISITQCDFTLRLSERTKLAHAISTILNSEETPVPLYEACGDFITDISTPLIDDSPEMIERALALEEEPLMGKHRVRSSAKGESHAK